MSIGIVELVLFVILVYWIGAIFVIVKKGLNEIIKALQSIDEKLARLEQLR